jgi:hypothetical protein
VRRRRGRQPGRRDPWFDRQLNRHSSFVAASVDP